MRLFTCIHGRQELTNAFFWHLQYLRDETGYELPISVCYSEDADYEAIKDHLKECDSAVKYSNLYLGDKFNYLVANMIKTHPSTRYMCIGSDDFMSVEYVKHMVENNYPYAGINRIYFYEMHTGKAIDFTYQHPFNITLGAGRVYSHKILSRVFSTGDLWLEKQQSSLDNQAEKELYNRLGIKPKLIDFNEPQIVDVKTFENIHSFEEYRAKGKKVTAKKVLKLMPKVEFE